MHNQSGLQEKLKNNEGINGVTTGAARILFEGWLREIELGKSEGILMGSTIGFDRSFLSYHMPSINEYFHYRSIDVSSLKILLKRWAPNTVATDTPVGKKLHRSLPDIEDTLNELTFYQQFMPLDNIKPETIQPGSVLRTRPMVEKETGSS